MFHRTLKPQRAPRPATLTAHPYRKPLSGAVLAKLPKRPSNAALRAAREFMAPADWKEPQK